MEWNRNNPQSGISKINTHGEGNAVMKINPACWDITLPVTAVQFISFEYRPATKEELEEFNLNDNGLTDCFGLSNNSFSIEKMGVLIQQK